MLTHTHTHNTDYPTLLLRDICHEASCMQANDAEGRKNDRLRKEKKGKKGRNLTKVNRYLQGKRGVPTTGKFRLVAGNTIRAEACYITPPL